MKRLALLRLALLMMAAAGLSGCPNGAANPPQLWIALDGDELHAKLVDVQPPHF
jgi:hypothetical protein